MPGTTNSNTVAISDSQPGPNMEFPSWSGLVLLHLYRNLTNYSGKRLARALDVSPAYTSLMLAGTRSVSDGVKARLSQLMANHSGLGFLQHLCLDLENRLGRALSEEELIVLISHHETLGPMLSNFDANVYDGKVQSGKTEDESGFAPERSQRTFEVSTALASLTSIADILVEEPDLPIDQRQQFLERMKDAAGRLTGLLPGQQNKGGNGLASQPRKRPETFVNQTFLEAGYYFSDLEKEADLIARRTRRHGPLGTFALVARLETDLGRSVEWVDGAGMAPSSVGVAATRNVQENICLDPSLGQAQLRFRLAQFLVAQEAGAILEKLVDSYSPPDEACALALRKALVAYTAAAMFMPYEAFLNAATEQRYDIDWLGRHFGCSFDQICHRLIALRKPGQVGVPFGMLRVSPAGHTITRIALPGLALPDQQAGCPLWAAYAALQRPGETITQLAELPEGERFLMVGRTAAGPRAHYGQPRRLTSVMLACDWAYAGALIYSDAHDPGRPTSISFVGSTCRACPREICENRVTPYGG